MNWLARSSTSVGRCHPIRRAPPSLRINLAKQFTRDEMVIAGERPRHKPEVRWSNDWPERIYVLSAWPLAQRQAVVANGPVSLARIADVCGSCGAGTSIAFSRCFPRASSCSRATSLAVMTGRPLYLYFHNTYCENRRGLSRGFARWLQHRHSAGQSMFSSSTAECRNSIRSAIPGCGRRRWSMQSTVRSRTSTGCRPWVRPCVWRSLAT